MRPHSQALLLTFLILGSLFVNKFYFRGFSAPEELPPSSFNQAVAVSVSGGSPAPTIPSERLSAFNPPAPSLPKKATTLPLVVEAAAALAVDLQSGFEFFSYNVKQRWPIASLTKLMTALVAKERIGEQKEVILSGGLIVGGRYSARDLIKAMMLVSSNDAALALAEFYGTERFVSAMNEKAKELGLRQTVFADPTGLSILNQSTLTDLLKLAEVIYERSPEIFNFSRQPSDIIMELNANQEITLININKFAKEEPSFLGGKTGYTDEAQQNLLSIFNLNNRPVLIIVLGAKDRFAETLKIFNWIKTVYLL